MNNDSAFAGHPVIGRPRIYERDTDALFIGLLRENEDVGEIFAKHVLGRPVEAALLVRGQIRHQGGNGSIDLVIDFKDGPMLLVENKIDAAYSITREGHGQPQRYLASVAALRRTGREVHSVLLAPARYLAGSRLASMFDARLPYEAFLEVLDGAELALLQSAIQQAETPYEPVPNIKSADFFLSIRRLIEERFPDLVMKHDPNYDGVRPDASRTIYFDVGRTLRAHPDVPRPRMSLQCWDSAARSASLKIMLADRARLAGQLAVPADLRDAGGYLRPAGRSLGITVDTPRLDTQRPFAEQADDVVEALEAALRLQAWWSANGEVLRHWARA